MVVLLLRVQCRYWCQGLQCARDVFRCSIVGTVLQPHSSTLPHRTLRISQVSHACMTLTLLYTINDSSHGLFFSTLFSFVYLLVVLHCLDNITQCYDSLKFREKQSDSCICLDTLCGFLDDYSGGKNWYFESPLSNFYKLKFKLMFFSLFGKVFFRILFTRTFLILVWSMHPLCRGTYSSFGKSRVKGLSSQLLTYRVFLWL